MTVRLGGTVFIASLMMTAGAQASSFVVIAAPKAKISNSMVAVDAPKPATEVSETSGVVPLAFAMPEIGAVRMVKISASVVAFESTIPDIAYENVAAISNEKPKTRPAFLSTPMVMRGGIIGDAFAAPAAARERPVGKATNQPAAKSPASASAEASGPIPRRSEEKPADRRLPKAPPEPLPVPLAPPTSMPRLEDIR